MCGRILEECDGLEGWELMNRREDPGISYMRRYVGNGERGREYVRSR